METNRSENTANGSDMQTFNRAVDINALPRFTRAELSAFNGKDKSQVYVAIKGEVYDVSSLNNYAPGKPYHKLVGKDISRLLGLNTLASPSGGDQLSPDETWSLEGLTPNQIALVDQWVEFFRKRYPIVGAVSEL